MEQEEVRNIIICGVPTRVDDAQNVMTGIAVLNSLTSHSEANDQAEGVESRWE